METEQQPTPKVPIPPSQNLEHPVFEDSDEISLVDIIRFFLRRWKFISITTVGISALAVGYSFLQPNPPYQTQLTLALKFNPLFLADQSQVPDLDLNRANNLAVDLLQSQTPEQFTLTPTYDTTKQQITLTLTSPDATALTEAASQVLEQLTTDFQEALKSDIEASLAEVAVYIERQEKIVAQLEAQLAQTVPTDLARQEAIEQERAKQLADLTSFQFDQQYLKQLQQDSQAFTQQVLPISIVSESEVTQSARSPLQLAILSLIAGFMVAVLAAIIREQIPRIQAELAAQKPERPTH